jgi:hypothetical protein
MPNDSLRPLNGIKFSELADAMVVTAKSKATTEPGLEMDSIFIASFAASDKNMKVVFQAEIRNATKMGPNPVGSAAPCFIIHLNIILFLIHGGED